MKRRRRENNKIAEKERIQEKGRKIIKVRRETMDYGGGRKIKKKRERGLVKHCAQF